MKEPRMKSPVPSKVPADKKTGSEGFLISPSLLLRASSSMPGEQPSDHAAETPE